MSTQTVYEVVYELPPPGPGAEQATVARTAALADAMQAALLHMPTVGIGDLPSPHFAEARPGYWVGAVAGAGVYRIRRLTGLEAE
jgi:hypothetical protein